MCIRDRIRCNVSIASHLEIIRHSQDRRLTINLNGFFFGHETKVPIASCKPCFEDLGPSSFVGFGRKGSIRCWVTARCDGRSQHHLGWARMLVIRFVATWSCVRVRVFGVCKAGCELWNLCNGLYMGMVPDMATDRVAHPQPFRLKWSSHLLLLATLVLLAPWMLLLLAPWVTIVL